MGTPGTGKSTLLIMLAFYLVFNRKKNVLVFRRLEHQDQTNCLFYMGYQGGQMVYFVVKKCTTQRAIEIYQELDDRKEDSDVWLFLDGLSFRSIPEELRTFKLLATSEEVGLKSAEFLTTFTCLCSAWIKRDLFELGTHVYDFTEEEMEERLYYSGGSVRKFVRDCLEDARRVDMCALTPALCNANFVPHSMYVADRMELLDYIWLKCWMRVIDSDFVFRRLSTRIRPDALVRFYHWARSSNHEALAGAVLGAYIHCLAETRTFNFRYWLTVRSR